jgi:hypothetical protein
MCTEFMKIETKVCVQNEIYTCQMIRYCSDVRTLIINAQNGYKFSSLTVRGPFAAHIKLRQMTFSWVQFTWFAFRNFPSGTHVGLELGFQNALLSPHLMCACWNTKDQQQ